MIETKLADKPEQFQDERGAWHVGRRVLTCVTRGPKEVEVFFNFDDGLQPYNKRTIAFRLDHGPLVFVDPSRLSPCPASTTIVQRCGARMINSDGSPRSNIKEATK